MNFSASSARYASNLYSSARPLLTSALVALYCSSAKFLLFLGRSSANFPFLGRSCLGLFNIASAFAPHYCRIHSTQCVIVNVVFPYLKSYRIGTVLFPRIIPWIYPRTRFHFSSEYLHSPPRWKRVFLTSFLSPRL